MNPQIVVFEPQEMIFQQAANRARNTLRHKVGKMDLENQPEEVSRREPQDWVSIPEGVPYHDSRFWLLSMASIFLCLVFGYYLSLDPDWLKIEFQLSNSAHFIGLLLIVGAATVILKWPQTGLLALLALVYTHGSEIAVRYYGWPSLLQFLGPLLVLAILKREIFSDARELVGDWMVLLLALYGFVLFSSSLIATNRELADEKVIEHLKGLFIFVAIVNLATSRLALRWAVWVLVAVGAFLGTISTYQVLTSSYGTEFGGFGRIEVAQIVGEIREPRIGGPLGDPNFYAQILVPLVALALYLLWDEVSPLLKLLAAYSLAVILISIVFTYSRGGALALLVVLALATAKRFKVRHVLLTLAILAPLLYFVPQNFLGRLGTLSQLTSPEDESVVHLDTSIRERTLIMRAAWEMFSDHPILGVGAGNYVENHVEYARRIGATFSSYEEYGRPRFAHSLYLEIAAETGLVGLILFFTIIGAALGSGIRAVRLFKNVRDPRSAGLVSALILGMAGFLTTSLFLHGHYSRYLWLLVGLIVAAKHIATRQNELHLGTISVSRT